MPMIDLTYPVSDTMLVWPGNQRPIFAWKTRSNSEPCNITKINMEAHTGTHVDSPMHYLMDGLNLDDIPLEKFWGKARLFRFRDKPANQSITLKMVRDSGFSMGEAKIFVLETGIGALAEQRDYNYLYPVPDYDLLQWLIDSGVHSFMTDATAIDLPVEAAAGPRHKLWLKEGHPVVENLANLNLLPDNTDFTICAMPLRLAGREGSPCRAAAWVDS